MPGPTTFVTPPAWTGADGEMVVVVSRGEPARSNLQMEKLVAEQVQGYLVHHVRGRHDPLMIALAVQVIAADMISPPGSGRVVLTREHLLAYVQAAKAKLVEVRNDDA